MANNPGPEFNPYAPPSAVAELSGEGLAADELILAGRGTRLGAAILDNLLYGLTAIPAAVGAVSNSKPGPFQFEDIGAVPLSLSGLLFLGLACYQWYLISTLGQSLAKKWLGIKIVRVNGDPVGFVHGVVLRGWVIAALNNIPVVGRVIALVDAVMIFGNERRCLHDLIAGTKVVLAMPQV